MKSIHHSHWIDETARIGPSQKSGTQGADGAPVPKRSTNAKNRPIRIGFLPLTDSAPLVVAQHRGLFSKHGVAVELSREVGWATVREKVRQGELDASQAPAAMLWAMQLGLGCSPCEVLTAFVLNLNGNALTLARSLGPEAHTPVGLRDIVRSRKGKNPLTIGAVFPFSSHFLLITQWLRRSGLILEKDVRIAIVPPGQMFRNLVAGTIDGYAVGEPWNSIAVHENAGWCPLWSAALRYPQLEKVLLVTRKFAEGRAAEHAGIIQALDEAAAWCDELQNREPLAKLLSGKAYVNVSADILGPPLMGRFDAGNGSVESVPDFHIFHRGRANLPSPDKASDMQASLRAAGLISGQLDTGLPKRLFREDLYAEALGLALPKVTA
jgi:two-component system, oxyanion-binding sensor